MEEKLFSISDTLFDNLTLSPLDKLEGITYSTDKRYLCLVNDEEFKIIQSQCTTLENINDQLGKGESLYKITRSSEKYGIWSVLTVEIYDISEPDVVTWFKLDWRSPLYNKNSINMIKWIDELQKEANRWIRMS